MSTPSSLDKRSEAPSHDLDTCDREPIHIPGNIQPHGILLVLREPEWTILQASENLATLLRQDLNLLLNRPLAGVIGADITKLLQQSALATEFGPNPIYLQEISIDTPEGLIGFSAIVHRFEGLLFLELEYSKRAQSFSFPTFYRQFSDFLSRVKNLATLEELTKTAAEEIRRLTGFDRVLVYQFDSNWHGQVIAESSTEHLPSLLNLWFPSSDIPQQARKLYELNRLRLIADVNYKPVPIFPVLRPDTGTPLDLSFSTLRSVSPVHLEYMKNMGTASSMSISLLRDDGQLWGLISCHGVDPRMVAIETRTACDFLGQMLSVQTKASEQRAEFERRLRLKALTNQLLTLMAQEEHFVEGLINNQVALLSFAAASGAAVLYQGRCFLAGVTPGEVEVRKLVDWISANGNQELFHTDRLSEIYPRGESFREKYSGVLAISISKLHRSYVVWFRPEVIHTLEWAGDPRKQLDAKDVGPQRLSPRKSFEAWKEFVRGQSKAWTVAEIEAASDLRNAIVGIVLRKAEELAELTDELRRSNKELEAFSYSVSHDLRAPFRHIVGFAELLLQSPTSQLGATDQRYVNTIIKSAHFAGTLVDNLLNYSQVGRTVLHLKAVTMNKLVEEVIAVFKPETGERNIEWRIQEMKNSTGDPILIRLVWQNLLQNALKYTRSRQKAVIEVAATDRERETVYYVRDNGVGFDPAYREKLFGIFQRLHLAEEYEGTGIGLANVRRVIARHGGQTWAESQVDEGATFFFSLPHRPLTENESNAEANSFN